MSGTVVLVVVLAIVLIVGVAALLRTRPGRGRGLKQRFGPEYDRVAERHGDPKAAEQELDRRIREHDALNLRPLEPDERERYTRTWRSMQERFVDDPPGAAHQADQIIGGLLTALGYPSDDPARQLDLASVDHAHALPSYRQAHELAQQGRNPDPGSTELLREAVVQYRVMFEDLLGQSAAPVQADSR